MSILDAFRLNGRIAVVTGCSRGIGSAMAMALAEAGADIVGVSSSMTDDGGALGEHVRSLGRKFSGYACDLGDRVAVGSLVQTLKQHHPVIDVLVNNAGIIRRAPAVDHADADWDEVLGVNLSTPFILSREVGRDMVQRGGGKIIMTGSLLSFQGGLTVPGYAASKGGIVQLAMALSNEWAAHGVCVNAIVPGYIATDATQALRDDEQRGSAILGRIPAGRWGQPQDLAGAVVFLASSASDYVTGTTLAVDGGWLAR